MIVSDDMSEPGRNDKINGILTELLSTTRALVSILQIDDFDPDQLLGLQATRSQQFTELRQLVDPESSASTRPLEGHPLVSELLDLEQQAMTLAAKQRERVSDLVQGIKQQRRITMAYNGDLSKRPGQLLDKKGS